MNLGAIRRLLPTGARWRQRTGDACSVQTAFHNSLHSFQPCQPRCEWWAMNPRADIDLCYRYPLAENWRGKEGQPLLSAVTCACNAEKAVRRTENGCCITLDGPGRLPSRSAWICCVTWTECLPFSHRLPHPSNSKFLSALTVCHQVSAQSLGQPALNILLSYLSHHHPNQEVPVGLGSHSIALLPLFLLPPHHGNYIFVTCWGKQRIHIWKKFNRWKTTQMQSTQKTNCTNTN